MSELNDTPQTETLNDPQQVAEAQYTLGTEWADTFAQTGTVEQAKSAEIVLRNPTVYLHDVSPRQLPEELQSKWADLLDLSDSVAKVAGTHDSEWSDSTSGLEKLQSLMFSGNVDPTYRGSISDVMRLSSKLFKESTAIVPGNTQYYSGNVRGMQGWIQKYRSK